MVNRRTGGQPIVEHGRALLALAAGLLLALVALPFESRAEPQQAIAAVAKDGPTPPVPKLIVVVVVDQLSADLFAEHRARFTGGLKRLSEGVVFPNGFHSHAATETCPGHATILTGRHPSAHGIIGNLWTDRATGRSVYCVEDPEHPVPNRPEAPRGPANLRVSTCGEWLKAADPRSRVVGVSGKDRAAIALTGRNPDAVFWWDDRGFGFTSYLPKGVDAETRLAPVAAYNRALFDRWTASPPAWRVADQRCRSRAGPRRYGELTLDHRLPPAPWSPADALLQRNPSFLAWLRASPVLDELTADLALSLLEGYRLGRGAATDLLAISLSATDYVGHQYGNAGPEMCDHLAHLDRLLGRLLERLEATGAPFVVALTADHGALDAAERVAERGVASGRYEPAAIKESLSVRIREKLGLAYDPLIGDSEQPTVAPQATDPAIRQAIVDAATSLAGEQSGVVAAFPLASLLATTPAAGKPADELDLRERFALSVDRERSGDVALAFRPFFSRGFPKRPGAAIAGHGSPWNYDRRVPILFWWPGIVGFEQPLPVEVIDLAPTLAAIAQVDRPAVDGRCLDLQAGEVDLCSFD